MVPQIRSTGGSVRGEQHPEVSTLSRVPSSMLPAIEAAVAQLRAAQGASLRRSKKPHTTVTPLQLSISTVACAAEFMSQSSAGPPAAAQQLPLEGGGIIGATGVYPGQELQRMVQTAVDKQALPCLIPGG